MCRNVGKEAFDLVKGSELTEKERHLGAITTPVNNIPCSPVTDMIMKLFKLWQLSTEDCMSLWGLAQASHAGKSREEAAVILIDEVRSLLYIHKSLRILFPKNREIVYSWPTTPNRNFEGLSPVELILTEGVAGLERVKKYLECELGK